jgi:hypothetical protein
MESGQNEIKEISSRTESHIFGILLLAIAVNIFQELPKRT